MNTIVILDPRAGGPLQGMLVAARYRTLCASALDTLLALAAEQRLDAVVVHSARDGGVVIPDQVRLLRREYLLRDTAIVAVLFRSELADRVRSLWSGAANIINLPLQTGEVVSGVASVINRKRARSTLEAVSPAV